MSVEQIVGKGEQCRFKYKYSRHGEYKSQMIMNAIALIHVKSAVRQLDWRVRMIRAQVDEYILSCFTCTSFPKVRNWRSTCMFYMSFSRDFDLAAKTIKTSSDSEIRWVSWNFASFFSSFIAKKSYSSWKNLKFNEKVLFNDLFSKKIRYRKNW